MSFFKSSAPAQNDRETISTERSPRPRIRILHFLEFKLLDLCCQFPNNQINQQDTGRVLLLSKSVGVLCRANRKPRSTSSKYILIILIGSNPFWHRGLETILHSTSYQHHTQPRPQGSLLSCARKIGTPGQSGFRANSYWLLERQKRNNRKSR